MTDLGGKPFRVTTRFDSHYGDEQIHCFEDEILQIIPDVLDTTGHEAVGEVGIEKEVTHASVVSLIVTSQTHNWEFYDSLVVHCMRL